jgi:hypothetical protein
MRAEASKHPKSMQIVARSTVKHMKAIFNVASLAFYSIQLARNFSPVKAQFGVL